MEKMIIGGAIGIIVALLLNMTQWIFHVILPYQN
jgi:ABC-type multidrug transport system permease subunit